jgi:hypothetical protein
VHLIVESGLRNISRLTGLQGVELLELDRQYPTSESGWVIAPVQYSMY